MPPDRAILASPAEPWKAEQPLLAHLRPTPAREVRFFELDSLRAFAAMTVVLLHFENVFLPHGTFSQLSQRQLLAQRLIAPFTSGNSAVGVFFVLSGFVLMLPFLNGTSKSYGAFVLRRFLRIYGPYLVALALALAGAVLWPGPRDMGDWGYGPWAQAPTLRSTLNYVLMLRAFPVQFNPVFWSLIVEMHISLLFPLLARFVMRTQPLPVIATALALSGFARYAVRRGAALDTLTLEYIGMFLCGMLLAKYLHAVGRRFSDLPRPLRLGIGVLGVSSYLSSGHTRHGADWAVTVAALCFIVIAMYSDTANRLLNLEAPRVLGRISYSLYLVHVPVLMLIVIFLRGHLAPVLLLPLYLAGAFVSAALFYVGVERPFTRWSRRVAHVRVTAS